MWMKELSNDENRASPMIIFKMRIWSKKNSSIDMIASEWVEGEEGCMGKNQQECVES